MTQYTPIYICQASGQTGACSRRQETQAFGETSLVAGVPQKPEDEVDQDEWRCGPLEGRVNEEDELRIQIVGTPPEHIRGAGVAGRHRIHRPNQRVRSDARPA